MDTKKNPGENLHFVILIPHRDALPGLSEYRKKVFSLGFYGAHAFPLAAALFRVSFRLSRDELKELARNIRDRTRGNDGKITSAGSSMVKDEPFSFFGPALSLFLDEGVFPESARDRILFSFNPPVLCAALICPGGGWPQNGRGDQVDQGPLFSFRAAALANLTIRPLPGRTNISDQADNPGCADISGRTDEAEYNSADYSFEWKSGSPVWLPAYKKR